uniref:Putative secreted protein n=1 Tax=Anopheles darlingi TaxID=43151 RepID=A0A2M4D037_ANODA
MLILNIFMILCCCLVPPWGAYRWATYWAEVTSTHTRARTHQHKLSTIPKVNTVGWIESLDFEAAKAGNTQRRD